MKRPGGALYQTGDQQSQSPMNVQCLCHRDMTWSQRRNDLSSGGQGEKLRPFVLVLTFGVRRRDNSATIGFVPSNRCTGPQIFAGARRIACAFVGRWENAETTARCEKRRAAVQRQRPSFRVSKCSK